LLILIIAAALAVGCFLYIRSQAGFSSEAGPEPRKPQPGIDLTNLEAKAAQGDAQAQTELGRAYAQGLGVKTDYKQAARWYGKAASNGNLEAELAFGELCLAGQAGRQDADAAIRWLTQAAQEGSAAAQYDLGYMYERGQKVPHDEKLAGHWLQLAAEGGEPTAQFDYGQRCCAGLGVPLDQIEGLKWLLIAAGQGQEDSAQSAKLEQQKMSGGQIAEAKRRVAAFVPRPAHANPGRGPATNAPLSKPVH
jgi:TPR repeat protein